MVNPYAGRYLLRFGYFALLVGVFLFFASCDGDGLTKTEEDLNYSDINGNEKTIETISPVPEIRTDGTLTLSIMSVGSLDYAIEGFEKKYPDIDIIIDSFDSYVDGDLESYLTRLQTQMLSGQGSDIISGINIYNFMQKGLLDDLNTYIDNDNSINIESDYYPNVFNAFKTDGKQYQIPAFIRIRTIGFNLLNYTGALPDSEAMSFYEAIELSKGIFDSSSEYSAIHFAYESTLFNNIFQFDADKYIDVGKKEVYFNTQEFKDLLQYCKDLNGNGYVNTKSQGETKGEYIISTGSILSNPYATLNRTTGQPIESSVKPLSNRRGELIIDAYLGLSISKNSQNKDLAWLFIKYLLSEECQSSPAVIREFLPVRRDSVAIAVYERAKLEAGSDWIKNNNDIEYINDSDTLNKHVQLINTCFNMPLTYNKMDSSYILEVIYEASNFFEDIESADETANKLQQKISRMLDE